MGYEKHTWYVCLIIQLRYFVRMDPNSVDSDPIDATSRWNLLAKGYKIVINQTFMMKSVQKKQKSRIENNDFTTILDSENVNGMMPCTKFCSNLTDGVPGGSVVHTGSPWTLKITWYYLPQVETPFWAPKSDLSQFWRFLLVHPTTK